MKKISVLCLIIAVVLTGCATSGMISTYGDSKVGASLMESITGNYTDEDVTVSAETITDPDKRTVRSLAITVTNTGDTPVIIDLDRSAFIHDAISERVVNGETRKLDAANPQAVSVAAPGTSINLNLFSGTGEDYSFNIWKTNACSLMLALNIDGSDRYVTIPLSSSDEFAPDAEYLGTISAEKNIWHFLFIGGREEKLKTLIQEKATEEFGVEAYVANVRYSTNWSALSLVLYFNMLGYVENCTVTADVYR